MKKIVFLFTLLTFIIPIELLSQSFQDVENPIFKKDVSVKLTNHKFQQKNNDPIEYNFCDEDGDGYIEINIEELQNEVLATSGLEDGDNEAILISTSFGELIKINTPSYNSSIEPVCLLPQALTDVAIDENKNVFATSFTQVLETDTLTCTSNTLFTFSLGFDLNSLSFDTDGNMYYGNATSSNVYRYDKDGLTPPYIWHDFGSGNAGGDFVMLNGKLYVSWKTGSDYRLYEVTVDVDFNYVTHTDLGAILDKTYGLASELGKLYGVTPSKLYSINPEAVNDSNFDTIISNDGTHGSWWGAAGLHEAVILESSAYVNNDDAISGNNPLPDNWINTIEGGQVIFIRIENIINGEFNIILVTINIFKTPQITKPNNLEHCAETTTDTFTLTDVEDELLSNVNQDVIVTYHFNLNDALHGEFPLNTIYESIFSEQLIYIRVQNKNDDCFALTEFQIITNPYPSVASITSDIESRLLLNCYIDRFNQGYFNLSEIYEQVVLDNSLDYELKFYHSYTDAEDGINLLESNYFATIGLQEELFVKVLNEFNCSKISNFFIDGDCILYTGDLSNIYFPKFFTPNDDSYNDYWNVRGISERLRLESRIEIYDRYGKIITTFKPSEIIGWDGYYNGKPLPPSDYWYRMVISNEMVYRGHFSLIRKLL